MRIISDKEIRDLKITPSQCIEWVREAFLIKDQCQLPPKISLHPTGSDFINTMPCLLPEQFHTFGCKIVSRIQGSEPSLKSNLLIVNSSTGNLEALLECDWITAYRTGAVAALAIDTFKNSKSSVYSFIGLGVIGKATLDCFLSLYGDSEITVKLYNYKDHAFKIIDLFATKYPKVNFEIVEGIEALINDADVVVSCISYVRDLLVNDDNLFKPGVLVVPVHTRGFQNCDLFFDKVFADDEGHVKGFKYYDKFKNFGEISEVLQKKIIGRDNDEERILSYNIGLGLHDIYFGFNILNKLNKYSGIKDTGI